MDIIAVRAGLAGNASRVPNLRTFAYVPDSIAPPTFFVGEVTGEFDGAFGRGMDTLTVVCRVLVAWADDRTGQRQLDSFLSGAGEQSLKAALEWDSTLGGACDDLRVTGWSGYGLYEMNGNQYYGAEFNVTVIGEG
ncbi:hypothetical protein [Saccharopolyspora shandongensis]|uniref:hypothetical protein n=1 Tax=Saccharopolyspora shandongensis TaxID=418495 RepID=UPI0034014BB5